LALRYIVLGGEALHFPILKDWVVRHPLGTTRITNMYGITETTVHVTYHEVKQEDLDGNKSIIGRPLKNAGIYILGADGTILPGGAAGEIFVFGAISLRGG
jgi:non-ribosomal peptide synthetase component F